MGSVSLILQHRYAILYYTLLVAVVALPLFAAFELSATGDLAHKKIFPALQTLAKRGKLDFPVIDVAKAGWTLDQLRPRAACLS